MKLSGKHLQAMNNAERKLAANEARELADLPKGHPLEGMVKEFGQPLGGDLSGLPPGHPLLLRLKKAKEQAEALATQEAEGPQVDPAHVRRAKKVDEARVRLQQERVEEEEKQKNHVIAKKANAEIDKAMVSINKLVSRVEELHGSTSNDYLRVRLSRLRRMVAAFGRGLSEGRISTSRTL